MSGRVTAWSLACCWLAGAGGPPAGRLLLGGPSRLVASAGQSVAAASHY